MDRHTPPPPEVPRMPGVRKPHHPVLNSDTLSMDLARQDNPKSFKESNLSQVLVEYAQAAEFDIRVRLQNSQLRIFRGDVEPRYGSDDSILGLLDDWFDIFNTAFFGGGLGMLRRRYFLVHGIHSDDPSLDMSRELRGSFTSTHRGVDIIENGKIELNRDFALIPGEMEEHGWIIALLHEMLHAFFAYYRCECRRCHVSRHPSQGGSGGMMGQSGHGPNWLEAYYAILRGVKKQVKWKVQDQTLRGSMLREIARSGWEPTEEQKDRYGLNPRRRPEPKPELEPEPEPEFNPDVAAKDREAARTEEMNGVLARRRWPSPRPQSPPPEALQAEAPRPQLQAPRPQAPQPQARQAQARQPSQRGGSGFGGGELQRGSGEGAFMSGGLAHGSGSGSGRGLPISSSPPSGRPRRPSTIMTLWPGPRPEIEPPLPPVPDSVARPPRVDPNRQDRPRADQTRRPEASRPTRVEPRRPPHRHHRPRFPRERLEIGIPPGTVPPPEPPSRSHIAALQGRQPVQEPPRGPPQGPTSAVRAGMEAEGLQPPHEVEDIDAAIRESLRGQGGQPQDQENLEAVIRASRDAQEEAEMKELAKALTLSIEQATRDNIASQRLRDRLAAEEEAANEELIRRMIQEDTETEEEKDMRRKYTRKEF